MPWEQGLPSSGSRGVVHCSSCTQGSHLLLSPSLHLHTGCLHKHLMSLLMKQGTSQLSLGIRNILFSSLSRPTTLGVFSLFWGLIHRYTGPFSLVHVESPEV